MEKIKRITFYLFSFALGRGLLFISPILLANLLSSRSYGMIEWAYAAASLAATVSTMGTGSATPLVELKKVPAGTYTGVLGHHVGLVSVCIIFLGIIWLYGYSDILLLTILLLSTIALQGLWSTYLKTHGKGETSLFLDAGVFTMMTFAVIAAKYFQIIDVFTWVLLAVAVYVLFLFGATVSVLFKRLREGEVFSYRAVLVLGYPLMIATLVTTAATTSGRLVIGYLGGANLTADYSILARVAALPIIAHQIILVAKYRHLFILPDKEMERVVIFIVGMVAFSVLIFGSLFPIFGWFFGAKFVRAFDTYTLSALWILAQSVLWSAISVHDLINSRHQTTRIVLPWNLGFLLLSAPLAIIIINYIGISLEHFVYIHGLWMLLFYLIQIQAMYRAGIRMFRAWAMAIGSYVSLIALASLLYL